MPEIHSQASIRCYGYLDGLHAIERKKFLPESRQAAYDLGYADGLASHRQIPKRLSDLLEVMETPRSRKASKAWSAALAALRRSGK